MGLDGIEIIMEVEETFGVTIEDAEAEKISTPGDLIDVVMSKVGQGDARERGDAAGSLTHRAFNLLRACLMRDFHLKRRDVAPHAAMSALVTRTQRKVLLERLAAELGTRPLPDLVRPKWLVNSLIVCSVAVGIALAVYIFQGTPLWEYRVTFFLTATGVAVGTGLLAGVATKPFRFDFPPQLATAGDLSLWIVANKPGLAPCAPGKWAREQVAARVRGIVIEHLNCTKTYREDASFIEELGMG